MLLFIVAALYPSSVRSECLARVLEDVSNNCTGFLPVNTIIEVSGSVDGACSADANQFDSCGVRYCLSCSEVSTAGNGTSNEGLAVFFGLLSLFLVVCLLISLAVVFKLRGGIGGVTWEGIVNKFQFIGRVSTTINEAYGTREDARSSGISCSEAVATGEGVEDEDIAYNSIRSPTLPIPDITAQEADEKCTNNLPVISPSPPINSGNTLPIDDGSLEYSYPSIDNAYQPVVVETTSPPLPIDDEYSYPDNAYLPVIPNTLAIGDGSVEYSYTDARFATLDSGGKEESITLNTNVAYNPVAVPKPEEPQLEKKQAVATSPGNLYSPTATGTPSLLAVPHGGKNDLKSSQSTPSISTRGGSLPRAEGASEKNRVSVLAEEFEQFGQQSQQTEEVNISLKKRDSKEIN